MSEEPKTDIVETTKTVVETVASKSENFDVYMQNLTTAAEKITAELYDVGSKAAEAILTLVWIKGAFSLISSTIIFAVAYMYGSRLAKKLWADANKKESENDEMSGPIYASSVFVGVVTFAICTKQFFDVFHFYNWISVLYPEGALAYAALTAAGINL